MNKRQQILDDLQQENQDLHKLSEQLPQELAVLEGKVAEEQEKVKLQHQALEQSDALRNDNRSVLELGHELYQKRLGLKVPHPAQLTCDTRPSCSMQRGRVYADRAADSPRAACRAPQFERFSDGSLVIKMDNVDPADHARVFFFSVRLNDADDQWTGALARPHAARRTPPRAARIASTARVRAAARDPQRGAAAVRECVPMVDGLQALVDELNTTNSLSLFVRAVRQQWRRQVGA